MSEFILGIVIVALLVERYFFTKTLTQQLSNATKAVLSKNVNEYIAAVNSEKPVSHTAPESDEVLVSDADPKAFDAFIKSQQ